MLPTPPADPNTAPWKQTVLLASDYKNSVLAEQFAGETRHAAYSTYGVQSSGQELMTHLGFNGELREVRLGWYILGNGYRAYNPELMRFHSPDTLSPFGKGGLNAYMYCGGEPVMRKDPTGQGWVFDVFATVWSFVSPAGSGGAVAVQRNVQVKSAKQGGLWGVLGRALQDLEINKKPPTVRTAKSNRTRKHVTFRDGPLPGQGSPATTSVIQPANQMTSVSNAGSAPTMSHASSQYSLSSGSSRRSSSVSAPSSYRTISTLSIQSADSGFRSNASSSSSFSGTSSIQRRANALRQD